MDYRVLIIVAILIVVTGTLVSFLYFRVKSYRNFLKEFDKLEKEFQQLKGDIETIDVSDKFKYINTIDDSLSLIQTYRKMNLSKKDLTDKYLDLLDNFKKIKENIE